MRAASAKRPEISVSLTVSPYGTLPGRSPESRRLREISLARSVLKRRCEFRRSWRLLGSRFQRCASHQQSAGGCHESSFSSAERRPFSRRKAVPGNHTPEILRVAQIATQALGFRRNGGGPVWASISAILDEALALHDNRIEVAGIEVLRDYDATAKFRCHPGELRQVMVNLMGNAIDAMPFGGRLQLRVRRVTDGKTARPAVCITIADNGRGMSAATRRHAFEPFYTTKDRTRTGLGLWICADVVSRYRGRIAVRSTIYPDTAVRCFACSCLSEYFPTNAMSHAVRDYRKAPRISHVRIGHLRT